MAYSINYVGHISVTPPLNEAEFSYLTAFGETAHVAGMGVYEVADNPRAPRPEGGIRLLERPTDLPDVVCPWAPSCAGRCLIPDGRNDHRDAARWLQFLVDHFLKPGARASSSDNQEFAAFTFDHHLGAVVAAHRSDSGALWLIRAFGDEVSEETVWPGVFAY
jgi:hypothetical protein